MGRPGRGFCFAPGDHGADDLLDLRLQMRTGPSVELLLSSSAAYRGLLSTGGDAAAWVRPRRGAGPQGPLRPCAPPELSLSPGETRRRGSFLGPPPGPGTADRSDRQRASPRRSLRLPPPPSPTASGPPHRFVPHLPPRGRPWRRKTSLPAGPSPDSGPAPSAARSSSSRFYTGPARRPTPRSASRPLRTGRARVARAWVVDPPSGWAGSEADDRRGRPAPASLARGLRRTAQKSVEGRGSPFPVPVVAVPATLAGLDRPPRTSRRSTTRSARAPSQTLRGTGYTAVCGG